MILRRIEFRYLKLEIDVHPAIPELNPAYLAAGKAWVQPLTWAIEAKALSEEASNDALLRCYADAVIQGSPTPGYEHWNAQAWYRWLKDHPEEWRRLREICEAPEVFEDPDGDPERPGTPAS